MQSERHVKLFRNGHHQALHIPREFELEGDEAILRKDGNRLIIEPLGLDGLLSVLGRLEPVEDELPDIDEKLPPLDEVEL